MSVNVIMYLFINCWFTPFNLQIVRLSFGRSIPVRASRFNNGPSQSIFNERIGLVLIGLEENGALWIVATHLRCVHIAPSYYVSQTTPGLGQSI